MELFRNIVLDGDELSVNYTFLANAIAEKSEQTRQVLESRKNGNGTDKNDQNNRDGSGTDETLRSIWQGQPPPFGTWYSKITSH